MIYAIAYLICGVVVGVLASNVYLNKAYREELSHYGNFERKESPDYIAEVKTKAFHRAKVESQVDRAGSFVVGGLICWPITIFILAGYYTQPLWRFRQHQPFGLSKAAREVKKSKAEAIEIEAQKELEAENAAVWNSMVDVLNAHGLNHLNYQKK